MRSMRLPEIAVAAAAALLLVASVVGLVRSGDTEPGSAPSGEHAVAIIDFEFKPDSLATTAGTSVRWTNNDSAAHTVTSKGGGPLASGDIEPGGTYEATFTEPGTYEYFCKIHPSMQATVEVAP